MDILYLVDRLENLIASSRRIPLASQILIKESDMLNIIEQMRTSIPDEVKQSRRVIQDKERILAQAQADATHLLARTREESEHAMNREGLLRAAEERSQQIVRKAEEQAQQIIRKAEAHAEHLKVDADSYVMETLRNLREHLTSVETDVSRTILSIERGLESLEEQPNMASENHKNAENLDDIALLDEEDENAQQTMHSRPRRASLAADTMGGPNYQ